MALSRQFRIFKEQAIELRADAFNISNSFIPAVTATGAAGTSAVGNLVNLSSPVFGQLLYAEPSRKIQFALKYNF